MKDYYQILELQPNASPDEVRKAYRRLALRYHPDRNPGDDNAEDRFKEIAEAYGVLIDPVKKSEFDRYRKSASQKSQPTRNFRYTQEEILRDMIKNPSFNTIFHDLFKEFQKAGFRFDKGFFDKTFFGGRGIFFGGFFYWGTSPKETDVKENRIPPTEAVPKLPIISDFLHHVGSKLSGLLPSGLLSLPSSSPAPDRRLDLTYTLKVTPEMAVSGNWIRVSVKRAVGRETLKVKIPPGVRPGSRLRIKGKGNRRQQQTGDLYIVIQAG